jgi:ABC-type transport system involved in multi-copper enzyme maturation permease subunit
VNGPLFVRTLSSNALRLVLAALGLVFMGALLPLIYSAFGEEVGQFVEGNPLLRQLSQLGGGDIFSLDGIIAFGFVHPFTLLLMGILAIGFPALAIAGERDRGTLEVLLARPVSRRGLFATLYVAGLLFLGSLLLVLVTAMIVSTAAIGLVDELDIAGLAQLWLVGWLLFVAFMSLTFAASSMSDRIGPAIGIPLVFVLVNYLAWAIGSIWPDAAWLEDWSMFNLVKAQDVLADGLAVSDVLVLLAFSALCVAFTLLAFPRRDIAAPA